MWKTKIPTAITSVQEAKTFLYELWQNGESFHPEDDAHDILWDNGVNPSAEQCDQLNKLTTDIYKLKDFDPCEYLLDLDYIKEYGPRPSLDFSELSDDTIEQLFNECGLGTDAIISGDWTRDECIKQITDGYWKKDIPENGVVMLKEEGLIEG